MEWLLNNLEWIVGSIIIILRLIFWCFFYYQEECSKIWKYSTNIQIKEFNVELSYKDIKELCLDLIADKLNSYKEEASTGAKKGKKKLITDFIDELQKKYSQITKYISSLSFFN